MFSAIVKKNSSVQFGSVSWSGSEFQTAGPTTENARRSSTALAIWYVQLVMVDSIE